MCFLLSSCLGALPRLSRTHSSGMARYEKMTLYEFSMLAIAVIISALFIVVLKLLGLNDEDDS